MLTLSQLDTTRRFVENHAPKEAIICRFNLLMMKKVLYGLNLNLLGAKWYHPFLKMSSRPRQRRKQAHLSRFFKMKVKCSVVLKV